MKESRGGGEPNTDPELDTHHHHHHRHHHRHHHQMEYGTQQQQEDELEQLEHARIDSRTAQLGQQQQPHHHHHHKNNSGGNNNKEDNSAAAAMTITTTAASPDGGGSSSSNRGNSGTTRTTTATNNNNNSSSNNNNNNNHTSSNNNNNTTTNSNGNSNNNNSHQQQQHQEQHHHRYYNSHRNNSNSVSYSHSFTNGSTPSDSAGEPMGGQPLSARDPPGRRPPTPPGSRLLHRSSTEPSVSEQDSTSYVVRATPYERLSADLANDPRVMKEITLGRRIAFYRIRGEIGTGNFSQVKLGIHVLTKEKVAIKILDKTKLDQKTQRLLSREITSMERLHHPNVIRLYEVVETLAKLHIIMEYAGGGELFTKISNEGRLPEDEAKCLFAQLVAAVEHMHDNNIIHRDLKAENVFYASPRWIKVGDFGFSTVARTSETLNTFCGSPPYAAPELFKDEHYYGVFVDVWALGILLYFMVTGLMPFRAETVAKLKKCILDGSYTVPSYVSDSCVFLIRSILKHIPQDRFTVAEVKRSEWLDGQEFPGPLEAYKLNPSWESRDVDGEEREARSILENLGIKEDHIRQSSIKDSRSSITGTYRIVLHRVQKRSAGLPDAAFGGGAAGTSGSTTGGGGGYDTPDVMGQGEGRAGFSMTAVEKRRGRLLAPGNKTTRSVGSKPQSKTCVIL